MNKTNILIGILIVIIIVIGVVAFTPVKKVVDNVGALASPIIPYSYLGLGGGILELHTGQFTSASSTCVLDTPTASSTLIKYVVQGVRSDSAGATTYDISFASDKYATSSSATNDIILSQTWNNTSAIEHAFTGTSTIVINPATQNVILFKVSSSTLSSNFAPSGKCSALFLVL